MPQGKNQRPPKTVPTQGLKKVLPGDTVEVLVKIHVNIVGPFTTVPVGVGGMVRFRVKDAVSPLGGGEAG